jgi:Leu/Phe-tRNA-protein transferase
MHTPHLESLGARTMPRRDFLRRLADLIHLDRPTGSWSSESYRNDPCRS